MKNFIQRGDNITVAAPAAIVSGEGVQIGALFGIAACTVAAGEDVALSCYGVFELPKEATTEVLAVGDPVEWDAVNARIAPLNAGDRIGIVVRPAGATSASTAVRIG